jgi:hypothetical protein
MEREKPRYLRDQLSTDSSFMLLAVGFLMLLASLQRCQHLVRYVEIGEDLLYVFKSVDQSEHVRCGCRVPLSRGARGIHWIPEPWVGASRDSVSPCIGTTSLCCPP